MGERTDGIAEHNARVSKHLLEFRYRLRSSVVLEIALSAQVGRIEISKEARPTSRHTQFKRSGRLKQIERFRRVIVMQGCERSQLRQVNHSNVCIVGETLL